VKQLATVGAVLRETARLPQAAIVMSPAIISTPAVMTSLQLAATVRTQSIINNIVWQCAFLCTHLVLKSDTAWMK